MWRWKATDVDAALAAHGLTFRELNRLANRFRPIRNKVIAHNDPSAILSRDAVFRQAGIRASEIDGTADRLWEIVGEIYTRWFNGAPPDGPPYAGEDVDDIHRAYEEWRDGGRRHGSIQ
jgi:hypothetical protein